jgi:hypothetical protein
VVNAYDAVRKASFDEAVALIEIAMETMAEIIKNPENGVTLHKEQ